MSSTRYSMIGLMSGTSGDGLDLAFCQFEFHQEWNFEIVLAETIPFPENLGKNLAQSHLLSALDLALLDVEFGKWMGEQVKRFCKEHQLKPMAVASHGHTVFHQPQKGLSLQIGNGWALHEASGEMVICDFRMKDVQLGGQGAPLVPIGDELLFPQIDFCLNLGGISNISMRSGEQRIAFDVSPFNLLLNAEATKLGKPYDAGGTWAKEGNLNHDLLEALDSLPFYQHTGAKSLGREDMERDFIPLLDRFGLSPLDNLRTLIEHYASQISKVILKTPVKGKPLLLITGGGAYNQFFLERLDHYLSGEWELFLASKELIEFKEALVFAFLGVLKLRGEANCLRSVTGARADNCGGAIYQ